MRFLADESMPRAAVEALRLKGFDVTWVSDFGAGSPDENVLALSRHEERVLLTADKDFGDLVFRQGLSASSGVVLFRIDTSSPAEFCDIMLAAIESRDDWNGFFSVISRDRIRMRPLPAD